MNINKNTSRSLRRFNIIAGLFHLILAAIVLLLSNDFSLPVTATYLAGPPGSFFTDPIVLFEIRTGYAVALFLGLSSLFHFLVASTKFFPRYIKGLTKNINIFRWVEYSISSSLMILLIAQITGISDFGALIGIVGVNVSMILFGWLQERYAKPGDKDLLPIHIRLHCWYRSVDYRLDQRTVTWFAVRCHATSLCLRHYRIDICPV